MDLLQQIEKPEDAEVLVYSYYRDAEMHGSHLLLRLLKVLPDPLSQVNLTRHLADEARHAWLWTKRIKEIGRTPMAIRDGYQVRMGQKTGLTRKPLDLLALTIVAENRAVARYTEHMERPDVSEATREVLHAVSKDEIWHIDWVHKKAEQLAEEQGDPGLKQEAIERYEAIDRSVLAEFAEFEEELMKIASRVAAA